ncbi:transposase [Streptomyces sp. 21So2-11]|uniref:transposase n=1 Tax=Streptomyces sp. 21So2-11 TaxID=3144408 RepID=UPI003219B8B1
MSADAHALIDRRLYLGEAWAADDERRELAGVPDETAFATKPQLAGDMLEAAHASGIRTTWVAADEVYGGRELRARIRTLGYGYAIAVPTSHRVTTPGGGKSKVTALLERVPKRAWMRLKTGNGTKGERLYDWAMIDVNADDMVMVPVSPRELLALLRVFALPRPRQDTNPAHALRWSRWRRHHQHRATACHRRWNEISAAATT